MQGLKIPFEESKAWFLGKTCDASSLRSVNLVISQPWFANGHFQRTVMGQRPTFKVVKTTELTKVGRRPPRPGYVGQKMLLEKYVDPGQEPLRRVEDVWYKVQY